VRDGRKGKWKGGEGKETGQGGRKRDGREFGTGPPMSF